MLSRVMSGARSVAARHVAPAASRSVHAAAAIRAEEPFTYHLKAVPAQLGNYVIVAGDPFRIPDIASRFDDAEEVTMSRGLAIWTGKLEGVQVSAVSHGMGGPSSAIVLEELVQLGAHSILRVGTCGSLQAHVGLGDIVVSTACVRDEGTMQQYGVPLEMPAVAHPNCVQAMQETLATTDMTHYSGVSHCKDAFYSELPGFCVSELRNSERWKAWERCGVLATGMEEAVLFMLGQMRNYRAGSMLQVVGATHDDEPIALNPADGAKHREKLLTAGVDSMRQLIKNDLDGANPSSPITPNVPALPGRG